MAETGGAITGPCEALTAASRSRATQMLPCRAQSLRSNLHSVVRRRFHFLLPLWIRKTCDGKMYTQSLPGGRGAESRLSPAGEQGCFRPAQGSSMVGPGAKKVPPGGLWKRFPYVLPRVQTCPLSCVSGDMQRLTPSWN